MNKPHVSGWSDLDRLVTVGGLHIISTKRLTDGEIPDGFTITIIETNRGIYYQPCRVWPDGTYGNGNEDEALYLDERLDPVVYQTFYHAIQCCKKFAADPVARDELVWSRR